MIRGGWVPKTGKSIKRKSGGSGKRATLHAELKALGSASATGFTGHLDQ
jgi:hypothetical protein